MVKALVLSFFQFGKKLVMQCVFQRRELQSHSVHHRSRKLIVVFDSDSKRAAGVSFTQGTR